ncbi:MAG: COX15/CtaA family protein [Caulobacteraceae bacterium]
MAVWLFVVAAFVVAMVVVGGATRLTGSGLSITRWRPVSGAIPPLGHAAWLDLFSQYRSTPQYRLVNRGMSLGQFQFIFWWEWTHRLLGRAVGLVFAVPFLVFLATRRLRGVLAWRCLALLMLGGVQGLVGWWMVESGLERRVLVVPERLATHLGLALLLLAALVWTGLDAWSGPRRGTRGRRAGSLWPAIGGLFAAGVFLQCLLGALVAGNQEGLIDNDWPRMGGRWFPADYVHGGFWATAAHGPAAVQFDHRVFAYCLGLSALGIAVGAVRSGRLSMPARVLGLAVGAMAVLQIGLGIATLMSGVALPLAIGHQATAAALMIVATAFAWRTRRGTVS